MIELFNEDCMEGMKRYPDKHFDLAIVDPPYGINSENWDFTKPNRPELTKRIKSGYQKYITKKWDKEIPNDEYFGGLLKISKNQIIWGGNYFAEKLFKSRGWIYWNKGLDYEMSNNFSHGELAWTSFDKRLLSFKISPKAETNGGKERIHPTQKPVALYKWLLKNYAREGDLILDTHLGSGSIAIACYDMGFDLVGFEIDKDYYEGAVKRLEEKKRQGKLFHSI